MKSNDEGYPLGSLLGFPLFIHRSSLLIAPSLAFFVLFAGSTSGMLNGFILLAVILFSVLAHELAHAVTARAMGVPVRHIVLTWYGGYAQFWMQPATRSQEIFIAVAGPIANLAISAAAFALAPILFSYSNITSAGGRCSSHFTTFRHSNTRCVH